MVINACYITFFWHADIITLPKPNSFFQYLKKNLDHRSWHCSDYNDSKLMVQLLKKKKREKKPNSFSGLHILTAETLTYI